MSSFCGPVAILLIQMSLMTCSSSHFHEKYFGMNKLINGFFNMINLKMTNQDFCYMTERTLKMTNLLMTLNLASLLHLTLCVVFNKTLRASETGKLMRCGPPNRIDDFESNLKSGLKRRIIVDSDFNDLIESMISIFD